jgi:hypothetical protein
MFVLHCLSSQTKINQALCAEVSVLGIIISIKCSVTFFLLFFSSNNFKFKNTCLTFCLLVQVRSEAAGLRWSVQAYPEKEGQDHQEAGAQVVFYKPLPKNMIISFYWDPSLDLAFV